MIECLEIETVDFASVFVPPSIRDDLFFKAPGNCFSEFFRIADLFTAP